MFVLPATTHGRWACLAHDPRRVEIGIANIYNSKLIWTQWTFVPWKTKVQDSTKRVWRRSYREDARTVPVSFRIPRWYHFGYPNRNASRSRILSIGIASNSFWTILNFALLDCDNSSRLILFNFQAMPRARFLTRGIAFIFSTSSVHFGAM